MSCKEDHISIKLPCVKIGKTWDGIPSCSLASTGTAFASNLSSLTMVFKDSDGATALTLTSSGGDITITSASAWEWDVEAITPWALAIGNYSWEIETTDAAGIIKGYVSGELETIA